MEAVNSKSSIIRTILTEDGVVGSKERWWSGNKSFDFVNMDKEDEDGDDEIQETKENITERNNRLIEELNSPDSYTSPAVNDVEAVQRALDFILNLGLDDENFKEFGSDIFSCFYDVATTAEEPLRKFALLRTELAARMWISKYPSIRPAQVERKEKEQASTWSSNHQKEKENTTTNTTNTINEKDQEEEEEEEPSNDELLDFMMGIYSLERVGIAHDSKEEVRAALSKQTFEDIFDMEPGILFVRQLPVYNPCMEARDFTRLLTCSFYSSKTGIDIRLSMLNLFKLIPTFRPYRNFKSLKKDDENFDAYADQLTLIFNIVHVLSNYGEMRLSPNLLPQEFNYLNDPMHLDRVISFEDVHLAGEICHCLRVFGVKESDTLLSKGLNFLRKTQKLDGSWPTRDNIESAYFSYHATMCAVSALNPQRFRGFGPSDPSLLYELMQSRYSTRSGINNYFSLNSHHNSNSINPSGQGPTSQVRQQLTHALPASYASSSINHTKIGIFPDFLPVEIHPLSSFIELRDLYISKSESVRGEIDLPPKLYGMSRLKALIDEKKVYSKNERQYKMYKRFKSNEKKRKMNV